MNAGNTKVAAQQFRVCIQATMIGSPIAFEEEADPLSLDNSADGILKRK